MSVVPLTVALLVLSNVFMTFAWYAHLKDMAHRPWFVAALASWGIAFFEYLIQVPANRLGYSRLQMPQLKIMQEVIALAVFVPFYLYYVKQPLRWDYLWATLCMCGAVFFIFRGEFVGPPKGTSATSGLAGSSTIVRVFRTDHEPHSDRTESSRP
jgi:uncharacterized protein (DUF486 family)